MHVGTNVTHVAGEGAAGSLLAVNVYNPPPSVVREVFSGVNDILFYNAAEGRSSTYSDSGPSGRAAISIKCMKIE